MCKKNLQDYVTHVEDLVDTLTTNLVSHQDQWVRKVTVNRLFQIQGCMQRQTDDYMKLIENSVDIDDREMIRKVSKEIRKFK